MNESGISGWTDLVAGQMFAWQTHGLGVYGATKEI